jgi:phage gp29-like protein
MTLSAALRMRETAAGPNDDRDRKTRTDVPVVSFTDFDSVGQVKSALFQHERGQFAMSAQLVDRMFWDDRIKGVSDTRLNALFSLPLTFESMGNAGAVTALEKNWKRMFPRAQLRQLVKWGLYLGFGIGQLVWDLKDEQQMPRLKVWHPQFTYWRWDTRSFWVTTMEGPAEVVGGDKQWVLYTPYGEQLGWMDGLVRSLAIPFMCRQWAFRDWARSSEVHGLPIRGAVVPADAKREEKDKFASDIAALGRETIVQLPMVDENEKFDLKLIEAASDSHKTFMELLNQCNSSIAITLLGQNLTTEVPKGSGSRAAATVHDSVRGDFLKADAETTSDCLREQALKPWSGLNYGDPEQAPEPVWNVDPPEDKNEKATGLSNLANALSTFGQAAAPVDQRMVLEDYDVPLLSVEEEQKLKDEKAAKEDADRKAQAAGAKAKGGGKPK